MARAPLKAGSSPPSPPPAPSVAAQPQPQDIDTTEHAPSAPAAGPEGRPCRRPAPAPRLPRRCGSRRTFPATWRTRSERNRALRDPPSASRGAQPSAAPPAPRRARTDPRDPGLPRGRALNWGGGAGVNTALWLDPPPPEKAQLTPPKQNPTETDPPGPGDDADPKFGKK